MLDIVVALSYVCVCVCVCSSNVTKSENTVATVIAPGKTLLSKWNFVGISELKNNKSETTRKKHHSYRLTHTTKLTETVSQMTSQKNAKTQKERNKKKTTGSPKLYICQFRFDHSYKALALFDATPWQMPWWIYNSLPFLFYVVFESMLAYRPTNQPTDQPNEQNKVWLRLWYCGFCWIFYSAELSCTRNR